MIQAIINLLYRHPKSKLALYQKFGGYFDYLKMMKSRKLMESTAYRLPPVKSDPNGFPIYFLTGAKYLYQTLFCIQSLDKHSSARFRYILVDDGTFDEQLISKINKLLPGAIIITKELTEYNLEKNLPKAEFPALHQKRKEYAHIKKLTDVHTIAGNWKLVLDSDMLFLRNPTEILEWLKNPTQPIHMIDCMESYGYSQNLMKKLSGETIPSLVNVGVIGLDSKSIDWQKIEKWIPIMEAQEGKTYYLEQALTAMIIGDRPSQIFNTEQYVVNPSDEIILNQRGCLHHYVDLSKKGYFNIAWKNILNV